MKTLPSHAVGKKAIMGHLYVSYNSLYFPFLSDAGFKSVLLGSINRQCTLCEANDLVNPDDVNINTITDHIMVKKDSYLETIEAKVSCL